MIPEEENVALKAENARLLEQMKTVDALGQEPQARLAKDSQNGSKPPSSNRPGRKSQSLRK